MSDLELLRQVRVAQALEKLLDKLDKSNEQVERITSVADNALVLRLLTEFSELRHDVDRSVSRVSDKLDARIDKLDRDFSHRIDTLERDLTKRIDDLENVAEDAHEVAEQATEKADAAHEVAEHASEAAENAHEKADAAVEVTGQHKLEKPEPNEKAEQLTAGGKVIVGVLDRVDNMKVSTRLFILTLAAFATVAVVFYALHK